MRTNRLVRNGIFAGVAFNAGLVAIGIAISPGSVSGKAGLLSLLGPAVSLSFYLATAQLLNKQAACQIAFGLAAGAIYGSEILLEYAILPDTTLNIRLGWMEYGSVLALYFLAALWTSAQAGSVKPGVWAAFWSSILASLIWLAVLLLATEIFWGTARQHQVFLAEGDYEDFAHSGMTDFNAFTMQDLRGASFFHLLLGPVTALIVGAAGGLAGKYIHRWRAGQKAQDFR
jgi:hypothetical protein